MTTLREARAYLLPGLWSLAEKAGVHADINVDADADMLVVSAWRDGDPDPKRSLGFAIASEEIVDGSYKARFVPMMKELFSKLPS